MYEESHFFTFFFLTSNATMPKRLISGFSCWMQNSAVTKVISKIVSIFLDKVPRLSISIVIWILSSDTETSAATPLGGGARKVLAK